MYELSKIHGQLGHFFIFFFITNDNTAISRWPCNYLRFERSSEYRKTSWSTVRWNTNKTLCAQRKVYYGPCTFFSSGSEVRFGGIFSVSPENDVLKFSRALKLDYASVTVRYDICLCDPQSVGSDPPAERRRVIIKLVSIFKKKKKKTVGNDPDASPAEVVLRSNDLVGNRLAFRRGKCCDGQFLLVTGPSTLFWSYSVPIQLYSATFLF